MFKIRIKVLFKTEILTIFKIIKVEIDHRVLIFKKIYLKFKVDMILKAKNAK
jgi:hypothetical protein